MAGNSVIGALRVDLGLNSAQFTAGLKKAETSLASFGRAAAYGLAAVGTAAIAAGVALGVAVKHSIDHADALNKSAQKAGVTVEALSRLEYAAKLSDISLEGLTGGLQKLSKSMADVAMGSGPKAAFKALGIDVQDASGKLRSGTAVFADVADRFSRMQDGATKTALAIQIFGKSGAELIPLLNAGSAGLDDMAAESDKLGATISKGTAMAAERFNDTLTKIGSIMDGVVNKVMEAALPALQSLANTLASPEFARAAQQLATWIINAMNGVVQAITTVTNAVAGLRDFLDDSKSWTTPYTAAEYNNAARSAAMSGSDQYLNKKSAASLYAGFGFGKNGQMNVATPATGGGALDIVLPTATKTATKALSALDIKMSESAKKALEFTTSLRDGLTNAVTGFTDAILAGTNPLKAFADELGNIGKQLLNAGIQSLIGSLFPTSQVFKGSAFTPGGWGSSAFSGMPHFASGTMSAPPGMALVGERGPELVRFGGGEQVIPNSALGGGQSVVLVQMEPGLVAQILKQAANQSVQIVRTQAPAAVASAQRNKTMG